MSDAEGRPTRPALTREYILCTALTLIDRDGLEALTMRRLGAELGVDPMAVYRHVPNKGALLDGVGEILWRDGLDLDSLTTSGDWRQLLEHAMVGFRAALATHPRAVPIVATHPLVTEEQFAFLEAGLGLLEAGGLDPGPKALALLNVLAAFTIGHVLAEFAEPVGGAGGEVNLPRLTALAARFPRVAQLVAATDGEFDSTAQFRTGLTAILDGWPD